MIAATIRTGAPKSVVKIIPTIGIATSAPRSSSSLSLIVVHADTSGDRGLCPSSPMVMLNPFLLTLRSIGFPDHPWRWRKLLAGEVGAISGDLRPNCRPVKGLDPVPAPSKPAPGTRYRLEVQFSFSSFGSEMQRPGRFGFKNFRCQPARAIKPCADREPWTLFLPLQMRV